MMVLITVIVMLLLMLMMMMIGTGLDSMEIRGTLKSIIFQT